MFYVPFHIWDVIPIPLTKSIMFQDGYNHQPALNRIEANSPLVNEQFDPENHHCFRGNSSSNPVFYQGQQVNLLEGKSHVPTYMFHFIYGMSSFPLTFHQPALNPIETN